MKTITIEDGEERYKSGHNFGYPSGGILTVEEPLKVQSIFRCRKWTIEGMRFREINQYMYFATPGSGVLIQ